MQVGECVQREAGVQTVWAFAYLGKVHPNWGDRSCCSGLLGSKEGIYVEQEDALPF